MKIAQVAPLCESVPPQFYGGTERVIADLTDALVEAGHDVTLFASGDSVLNRSQVGVCGRWRRARLVTIRCRTTTGRCGRTIRR
jgi:hypothetical protein